MGSHLSSWLNVPNSLQDSQKAIYNWQFAHSIDFWSLVLSSACDTQRADGFSDALRPLIFPLVQVTLGAIKSAYLFPLTALHWHVLNVFPFSSLFPFKVDPIVTLLSLPIPPPPIPATPPITNLDLHPPLTLPPRRSRLHGTQTQLQAQGIDAPSAGLGILHPRAEAVSKDEGLR